MANYGTNDLRNGLKLMVDGEPCVVLDTDFVKPGKGQAFTRIKIRNLLSGRVVERTYKSGESVEGADVMEVEMEYLYNDSEFWHFMDPNSFEQIAADEKAVADNAVWLKEQDVCTVILWDGNPISVTPPNFVELEVTDTDPGLKGDTSSGGSKPATLATGATVKVPLFINIGDTLKIDTRTGDYVSRA